MHKSLEAAVNHRASLQAHPSLLSLQVRPQPRPTSGSQPMRPSNREAGWPMPQLLTSKAVPLNVCYVLGYLLRSNSEPIRCCRPHSTQPGSKARVHSPLSPLVLHGLPPHSYKPLNKSERWVPERKATCAWL